MINILLKIKTNTFKKEYFEKYFPHENLTTLA